MAEVKLGRFAGPFDKPPLEYFVQSPIGLVPKDKGLKTRFIFHLSYPRSGNSVNSGIPKELCTVKYPDFDEAVKLCLRDCFKLCLFSIVKLKNQTCPVLLGICRWRSHNGGF